MQIHLIGIRDSPDHRCVRDKEVKLERVRIVEFFLKKIYENFVGTLETVRNREVSVQRGSTVSCSRTTIMNSVRSLKEVGERENGSVRGRHECHACQANDERHQSVIRLHNT